MGALSRGVTRMTDAYMAEAMAAIEDPSFATEMCFREVILEGDSFGNHQTTTSSNHRPLSNWTVDTEGAT